MNREVTYENIRYGMMVEYHHQTGGYYAGVKVHFYNKKGVLIGNVYEFVAYDKLKLREPYKYDPRAGEDHPVNKKAGRKRHYQRFFLDKPMEEMKQAAFIALLNVTSYLLRQTQRHMD